MNEVAKIKIFLKKMVDKVKSAWNTAKEFVKRKLVKLAEFCEENPEAAVAIAGSAAVIAKKAVSAHRINMEDRRRRLDIFDPRTGEYVHLKKPLTHQQKLKVDRLRREDRTETYVHILDGMGIKFK